MISGEHQNCDENHCGLKCSVACNESGELPWLIWKKAGLIMTILHSRVCASNLERSNISRKIDRNGN